MTPGLGNGGVGSALAIAPIIGLQTILLFWLFDFSHNFPFALIFFNLNFGPLTLFWAAIAIIGGSLAGALCAAEIFAVREKPEDNASYWQVLSPLFDEWVWGSLASYRW